jgi:predicted HTH domain antitoxin
VREEDPMRITLEIPDNVMKEAKLPVKDASNEIRKSFAVWLYAKGILGAGKARELARVSLPEFYALLEKEGTFLNYDKDMLAEDLKTLEELGA